MILKALRRRKNSRIPIKTIEAEATRLGIERKPVKSIVIPVVGADYVEEAKVAVIFADRFCPDAEEIVVVGDQLGEAFGPLPSRTRVVNVEVDDQVPVDHAYSTIYKSRVTKLMAPLEAQCDSVLMIDADMVMLQQLNVPLLDGCMYGSFRHGGMQQKLKKAGRKFRLTELRGTTRPYLKYHLNSAFLAGSLSTWHKVSKLWLQYYHGIWGVLPDNQPPTDQLPLCCVLDHLDIRSIETGFWTNWPVSKQIGGRPARVPNQVISAHGGFPVSEWYRYLEDPDAELEFIDSNQTRKIRYLNNEEKTHGAAD